MQFDSNLYEIGLIAIEKTVTRIKPGDFKSTITNVITKLKVPVVNVLIC